MEPQVLVTQGRLAMTAAALDFTIKTLENAGEPGDRDVIKVVKALQILATSVNLGENVTADMPLSKLLSAVLGFPVRNSIFEMTPAKLSAMSSSDYELWVRQVRASEQIIKSHLDNPSIWFYLGRNKGKRADQHAFIKVNDLP